MLLESTSQNGRTKVSLKGKRRNFLFPLRMPKMMVTSNIILINREIQTSLSTYTHTHTHAQSGV